MNRVKEAKVVKLYREKGFSDWYEIYTEKGNPGTGRGFLTNFCPSLFESVTGIRMKKCEEVLVKITIQKVKVKK